MERNDTLRNLLIAAAVFVLIMAVAPRLIRLPAPPSAPIGADESASPRAQPADPTGEDGPIGTPEAASVRQAPGAAPDGGALVVVEAASEQEFALGAEPTNGVEVKPESSPYRMRLVTSSRGAGIVSATLTDHAESLIGPQRYQLLMPEEREDGSRLLSLAIEKINVDDQDVVLSDKNWHSDGVQPCTTAAGEGECVRFWIEIREADRPALKVTRTIRLPRQPRELRRHDLEAEVLVENLSDLPRRLFVSYRGGLGIRPLNPRFPDQFVDWAVHHGGRVEGRRKAFAEVHKSASQQVELYAPTPGASGAGLTWAATANTYFTCTIAPLNPDGSDHAGYLSQVAALDADGSTATLNDVTLRFLTESESLAPGAALRYPADVYLGEKEVDAFRSVEAYRLRNYYFQVAQGFGWCTFNWLVELMLWLLNGLHAIVRDYGVAIIILVLVVRTLLHPITKKGQVNMVRMQQRMQELAPKIEEIKKKFANDKARMNEEMMKLNINPAGQLITCLPMLIQMPIWVALYISLSNNILMRHEGFLFTWIHDLTAEDALFSFSAVHVPLFGWELTSFNLLPILVAIFMYTQQKLQPKPKPNPNLTDQQRQQQEMMQKMGPMMSIMMLLIFYKMPSGLNLYIMSSSLFGTIEQHRIRKHIKDQEEAGTLHKTEKPRKLFDGLLHRMGKPSFISRLQKMAAEAQRNKFEGTRKPKKRR